MDDYGGGVWGWVGMLLVLMVKIDDTLKLGWGESGEAWWWKWVLLTLGTGLAGTYRVELQEGFAAAGRCTDSHLRACVNACRRRHVRLFGWAGSVGRHPAKSTAVLATLPRTGLRHDAICVRATAISRRNSLRVARDTPEANASVNTSRLIAGDLLDAVLGALGRVGQMQLPR